MYFKIVLCVIHLSVIFAYFIFSNLSIVWRSRFIINNIIKVVFNMEIIGNLNMINSFFSQLLSNEVLLMTYRRRLVIQLNITLKKI